jgi:hypothetical protein
MSDKSLVQQLPRVGRIEGCEYTPAPAIAMAHVQIQYSTPSGERYALAMPALDALYLLNVLEAMARENNLDRLRRPPAG